MTLVKLVSLFC